MSKEAMKLALEALETLHDENMDYLTRNKLGGENNQCMVFAREAITALREALAEQPAQQEPVAWGVDWGKAGDIPCVSIIKRLPGGGIEVVAVEYAPYEYNPPAQRTWVGLTDEEIAKLDLSAVTVKDATSDVRAIEAKLKEKNT